MSQQYSREDLGAILEFLKVAEGLKDTLRSAHTSTGRKESVAEHTWRLCLLAICLESNYTDIDFNRLFRMLIIHDLGEIINGDIPAIYQDPSEDKNEEERADFLEVIEPLPKGQKAAFESLWDEYNEAKTPEAKLAKALDKLETILQHTQGKNPQDFDYAFNLTYGKQYTSLDETTRQLRTIIDAWTQKRGN